MIKKSRREKVVFEVIPLIDVMMIMVLFFSIAAFLPQFESSMNTFLPKSENTEKSKEAVVITINSSGSIFIENNAISKNELLKEIKLRTAQDKNLSLVLAADKNLKYENIVSVLDIMKKSGIPQIGLITEK